jgi:transcriptional regulator with XRE-family HTH domain
MTKNWDAVASAIRSRLDELDMTQAELAVRAGLAVETVRELRNNLVPRRRSPRTMSVLSEALNWPSDHLTAVLNGRSADGEAGESEEVSTIRDELTEIVAVEPGHGHRRLLVVLPVLVALSCLEFKPLRGLNSLPAPGTFSPVIVGC